MNTITFECETVTPLFLSGADGNTPELRPPSIKGMIRFWWRAINGHLPLKELKKREAGIFGSSDEQQGRSKINITLTERPNRKDIISSLWEEIPFNEKLSKRGTKYKVPTSYDGISYLLYSTFRLDRHRPYFKNGTNFTIKLSSLRGEALHETGKAFIFLVFFGALGTRSRRGAGSFRVKSVIYEGNGKYSNIFNTQHIQSKDQLIDHIITELKPFLVTTGVSNYSTLRNSKIFVLDAKNKWKEALESIGKPYADFRNGHVGRITDTPNFGFPIRHRKRNVTMGGGQLRTFQNVEEFFDRRASPLCFKIIKTNEETYFPTIIWLNGSLLPPNFEIMDRKGKIRKKPNDQIIDNFLNTLGDKLEVIL